MKFSLSIKDVNYVKILYKDSNGFARCAKASIKRITGLEVYACLKKEKFENIPTPQQVSIGFASDNGLYKATTTLTYTKYEEPYLFFYLKTPEEVDFQQNREYFRVNLAKDVIISYKEGDTLKKVSAQLHDISANGIGVKLENEISFPEQVFVDIYFTNREINAKAKYVRTDTEDEFIKSSFHFIDLPNQDLDYISRTCIIKQIEDKRKTLQ